MDLFSKGNEAFVDENYEDAIKLYTDAIEQDAAVDDFYANRAHAYIKLEQYNDAISDCIKALELNGSHTKALLRKGIAHFHSKQYSEAKESLQAAGHIDSSDKNIELWLRKSEAELDLKNSEEVNGVRVGISQTAGNLTTATTSGSDGQDKDVPMESKEIPMPSGLKSRYDWYQTESHVVLTILIKNVKKEDVVVDIQQHTLSATLRLPTGSDYSLELDLLHPVVPDRSLVKILSTKVEIKMKKQDGIRWEKLEGDGTQSNVKTFQPDGAAAAPATAATKYPSSSHYTRDWNKLVADIKEEEKNEKPEGDAALNALFQQIYRDGNDETRRAMNKSFVESSGTVLSTNWKEIGEKKIECKPPDGMEYKKYDV